ncbi:MAG: DUF1989 domain-containing protein [Alphaproteobacteria bacterium]|nr:DUF1989 domain-containing protein [Alphaproteobacteria bacterium]
MNRILRQTRYETKPFERAGILWPGLPQMPQGMQRSVVPGGGSRMLPVETGDEIRVFCSDGAQSAEILLIDHRGNSDPGMLGHSHRCAATGIMASLARRDDPRAMQMRATLTALGVDLQQIDVLRLFDEDTPPWTEFSFTAETDGYLFASAPERSARPLPHEQDSATEIWLYVKPNRSPRKKPFVLPPAPLLDPLQDFTIMPGHAHAYEVKKGQYVQIIDVRGRECSDFQAFTTRALDAGLERNIDPTSTRSMMGIIYPTPGLHARYFDVDHTPMLEIVQDTVGRHDSFGLACNARNYADKGYPGHINCSDNMSAAIARYGVRARGGWSSINFFFNTGIDARHCMISDEPWTRPGDYVLLQALEDLVCLSTSCPDDIDAANAWQPSEIQVRVYDHAPGFRRSIHYRKSPEAEPEMTQESGFYPAFSAHTRHFNDVSGYWLPHEMTNHGAIAEYWSVREKAGIFDMSSLRKYEVLGPDAGQLLDYCVTRNITKLAIGQVMYTAMCYEHGGMIDDGTVYRLARDNFRWVGGSDISGLWLKEKAQELGWNVWVKDATSNLNNVAVQGPNSRTILEAVFWTPPNRPTISELGWFRMTVARIGGFHGTPVVISRTGFTGELGYEVYCHPNDAETIFTALQAAGVERGLMPCGMAALDMLRIEAALVIAGQEFTDQTDPFEAGIAFTVPLKSKQGDFIGRAALEERKAHPQRHLVGLDIAGGLIPVTGDCIHLGRAQIGEITSAMRSPVLGKTIALARVDVRHATLNTVLEVGQLDGQQKRLSATVVGLSHYDPSKSRVRA